MLRSALATLVLLCACEAPLDARETAIVGAMVRADGPLIRSRPALMAGKYARMARFDAAGGEGAFDFYRGEAPVFRADLADGRLPIARTEFEAAGPLPFSFGDPHPENFGILVASDGTAALEPNDLDAADRIPYHWELRRLTVGLVLAARQSNADDAAARAAAIAAEADVVRACVTAYRDQTHALAGGAALARVTTGGGSAVIADLFRRSASGAGTTLDELTTLDGSGARHLRRGVLDPTQPEQVFVELSDAARADVPRVLEAARARMTSPPPAEQFTLIDAVRELGSGVASWPRVRAIVLLRGPSDASDDDLLLELKELGDSGAPAVYPPFRPTDDVAARIVLATQTVWARADADPFWVATPSWLGMPAQVRSETNAHPTLRVHRLHGALGTPAALVDLARVLGGLLARITARGLDGSVAPARAIDAAIQRDPDRFVESEVAVAIEHATRTEEDFERFRSALDRLGLDLGVPADAADRPRPELMDLFCAPPTVPTPEPYR